MGLVKDVGENALDFYKLKVTAETADDGVKVTTEIEIAVVDSEAAYEEKPRPRRSYSFRVRENAKDALVANLSELDFGQKKGEVVTDVLILNNEAKERFTVTDKGLLFTKVRNLGFTQPGCPTIWLDLISSIPFVSGHKTRGRWPYLRACYNGNRIKLDHEV